MYASKCLPTENPAARRKYKSEARLSESRSCFVHNIISVH